MVLQEAGLQGTEPGAAEGGAPATSLTPQQRASLVKQLPEVEAAPVAEAVACLSGSDAQVLLLAPCPNSKYPQVTVLI